MEDKMNEKILKSHAMCIQVVTQVFAELWKHNHHANFQLINKKIPTENRYQFHHQSSFFFSACMQKNSNTITPYGVILDVQLFHSWIFLGVQLFLDIPGSFWAYNYVCEAARIRKDKIIKLWFCGFGFVGLFLSF